MRSVIAGLLLVAGCDRAFGLEREDAARSCFGKSGNGAGLLSVCLDTLPQEPAVLGGSVDTDAACDQVVVQDDGMGTEVCVIAGTTIDIGTGVEATGSRPLVLVATDRLTIASTGAIDVSSRRLLGTDGAGASVGSCSALSQIGGSRNRGGAGGAGGSFGASGGNGGDGSTANPPNSPGGVALPAVLLTSVRGGCQGGRGGNGVSQKAGRAGDGGGAVYLIAGAAIEVGGSINASGEAGRGGGNDTSGNGGSGGGGGGSGGLIGLDAPVVGIASTARLVANGAGGGGGGGTGGGAIDGMNGSQANVLTGTPPFLAPAGLGGTPGGSRGGSGGHRDSVEGGNGDNASFAAGGGGGSVGYVQVFTTTPSIDPAAVISPAPST